MDVWNVRPVWLTLPSVPKFVAVVAVSLISNRSAVMTGGAAPPRYRLGISANIINLTNHANFTGYSGTMTSPFFLQPQNVQNMRKVDISLNFSF